MHTNTAAERTEFFAHIRRWMAARQGPERDDNEPLDGDGTGGDESGGGLTSSTTLGGSPTGQGVGFDPNKGERDPDDHSTITELGRDYDSDEDLNRI